MSDDIDDTVGCFANVLLQRCRLSGGGCRFAALRFAEQVRHATSVHSVGYCASYFEQQAIESLPVGTTLLKCRLCDMMVADLEVESVFKHHYVTDHSEQIQDDKHYHQSYILANIEGQIDPPDVYQVAEPISIPQTMEAVIIDQSGTIQLQQATSQPILILNSDCMNSNTIPMSFINCTPSRSWQSSDKITLTVAEAEPVQSLTPPFTNSFIPPQHPPPPPPSLPTSNSPDLFTSSLVDTKLFNPPTTTGCEITPGARKSLPGSIPPPLFDDADELNCFLCPGVRFASRDVLSRHCNTEHSMENFILTLNTEHIQATKKPLRCPFCIFRALKRDRFNNHLRRHHTPEDIYLVNLTKVNAASVTRKKRQKKAASSVMEAEIVTTPNEMKAPMFCSLCDFSTQVRTHLTFKHSRDLN